MDGVSPGCCSTKRKPSVVKQLNSARKYLRSPEKTDECHVHQGVKSSERAEFKQIGRRHSTARILISFGDEQLPTVGYEHWSHDSL